MEFILLLNLAFAKYTVPFDSIQSQDQLPLAFRYNQWDLLSNRRPAKPSPRDAEFFQCMRRAGRKLRYSSTGIAFRAFDEAMRMGPCECSNVHARLATNRIIVTT